jgi:hypothetical protein
MDYNPARTSSARVRSKAITIARLIGPYDYLGHRIRLQAFHGRHCREAAELKKIAALSGEPTLAYSDDTRIAIRMDLCQPDRLRQRLKMVET